MCGRSVYFFFLIYALTICFLRLVTGQKICHNIERSHMEDRILNSLVTELLNLTETKIVMFDVEESVTLPWIWRLALLLPFTLRFLHDATFLLYFCFDSMLVIHPQTNFCEGIIENNDESDVAVVDHPQQSLKYDFVIRGEIFIRRR